METKLEGLLDRFEGLLDRLESAEGGPAPKKGGKGKATVKLHPQHESRIKAWWHKVVSKLKEWAKAAYDIGKKTLHFVVECVEKAFFIIEDVIKLAGSEKNPGQTVLQKVVIAVIQEIVSKLQDHNRKKDTKDIETHIKAVISGLESLAWIMFPDPQDHVRKSLDGITFYGNKLLKNKNEKDTAYVKAWQTVIREMMAYVKEHHQEGLEWNDTYGQSTAEEKLQKLLGASQKQHESGQPSLHFEDDSTQTSDQNAIPTPQGASLIPPPPPPPPSLFIEGDKRSDDTSANASKMFDEINKLGEDGVRSEFASNLELLRKAPKIDKTLPPLKPKPRAPKQETKAKAPVQKIADLQVRGNQVFISNYVGDTFNFNDDQYDMSKSFIIDGCQKCVFSFNVKIKGATIFHNKGSKFIIKDGLIASFEILHSKSVAVQSDKSVPTITVDNCEGVEIYLKKESKLTEIVTSKSSEVVMNFEKDKPVNEDDEWETYSIPSQFVTKIGDDTPTTKEVVHMA